MCHPCAQRRPAVWILEPAPERAQSKAAETAVATVSGMLEETSKTMVETHMEKIEKETVVYDATATSS